MKIVDYLQSNELFYFDRLKCLRNEYYYNECSNCIEICPENAFSFIQKKITLDTESCTGCAVCVGVCPTEALQSKNFDPNKFSQKFISKSENRLSCKSNTPCLSVFDTHHYIYMILEKKSDLVCDLKECEGCLLNKDGKVLKEIEDRIDEANRFLKAIGFENEIKKDSEDKKLSRREIFGRIFKEIKEYEPLPLDEEKEHKAEVPKKLILLKEALKKFVLEKESSIFKGDFSFIVSKKIEDSCTNCGECIQFCPTEALFYSSDSSKILFQSGKCINCDICDDICKEKSVKTLDKEEFDLSVFAFDRMDVLIEFDLRICRVCKCAFPAKKDEDICPRCFHFENNYQDIFKLASEE